MAIRLAVAIVLALLCATGWASADGPVGVAIVVAPENGVWSCAGSNPDAAFACARQKCRDAGERDCYRTNWCYPARWGVLYSARTAEFHGPDAFCGAPTREEALATLERWCRADENIVSCYVSRLLTPDGGVEDVEREIAIGR